MATVESNNSTYVKIGQQRPENAINAEEEIPTEEAERKKRESRRALCCSLITLVLSIPALIGA